MGFSEAIRTCFRKYADFNGRARRSEFWYWILFTVLVGMVAGILDSSLDLQPRLETGEIDVTASGPFASISSLALLLPGLAVGVRRLHDLGRSGWWILLGLIPLIGQLILLFGFLIKDSEPGDNRFGPNPKGVAGGFGEYPPYGQQPYEQQPYDPQNPYGQQPGPAPFDPQDPYGRPPTDQPPQR